MQIVIYALAAVGGLTVVLTVGVLAISIAVAKVAPEDDGPCFCTYTGEDCIWPDEIRASREGKSPCEGCSVLREARGRKEESETGKEQAW